MAQEDETPMLGRAVTFTRNPAVVKPPVYESASSFLSKVLGTKIAATGRVSESLDYEPIQNKLFYDRMKTRKEGKKKLYGYTGHTLAKMLVTVLTGVITGFFAVAMTKAVGAITAWKLGILAHSHDSEAPARAFVSFLLFWLIGGCLVSAATALVQYWAPASAGAGVTLVMAYLNGNHVPNLLRFNTLITKFVGTVCACSAGLPMGPEGPMVHIGACVASVITYMECKCLDGGMFNVFTNCFGRRKDQFNIKVTGAGASREFNCEEGQYNDVATLFLSSQHHTIIKLFSVGPLPLAGAATWLCTGVLAGVFRSAISLVVLVVEGTRGIDYLFGVIISVIVANWVAHHIHHDGVYESELERIGNVYMLRDEPPHRLFTLTAEAIMATGVLGFRSGEPLSRIPHMPRTVSYRGATGPHHLNPF
ncbi:Chloride channel protein CLC-a [Tetrabaena socialis]|uniref:Chloride channel protein CLC-a n=1 Tax=Tetrabaena socialis TaxID=47790 RepID=A0A2J8A108_9CHLO|nr:Chloride channel protein CLC-a [Tetrabaena socialis]|eukprot:PNH06168.1 Chloride channel protein CLC-a [Tetrabaena socialis]